jgi:hypothetical protein
MANKTVGSGRTALNFEAVTPHNATFLPGGECSALYIGTGGDVTMLNAAGNPILFKNVPSGSFLDCQTTRVNASGTTATDIVALY